MRPALAIPIFLFAAPALAGCPTSADLADGIRIEFEQTWVDIRQGDGPIIELRLEYKDEGRIYSYELYRGISALRSTFQTEVGSEPLSDTYYPMDTDRLGALWPINPGDSFVEDILETEVIEGKITELTYSVTFEPMQPVTIRNCTYDAILAVETYRRGDEAFSALSAYLPALGIAYLIGNRVNGQSHELFRPISIE